MSCLFYAYSLKFKIEIYNLGSGGFHSIKNCQTIWWAGGSVQDIDRKIYNSTILHYPHNLALDTFTNAFEENLRRVKCFFSSFYPI
jgi:hypothetical protein